MTKGHIIIMQFKRLVTLFLISPALIGCGQAALTPTPAKSATQAEVNEATGDIAHGHKQETEADSHIEAQMADQGSGQADIELPHIHGMGFSADDAIAYIVINPVRAEEIVLATFNRSIYLSDNGGQAWVPIAQEGKTVSED